MNNDFKKALDNLAEHIRQNRAIVKGEDATKLSFVLPFFEALGYDWKKPEDIIPEYYADFGGNKQNRVDYAIMRNGRPAMFVECKRNGEKNLTEHRPQLASYFASTSAAKIALLTNGIEYHFYSDLDEPNMLDKAPFLIIDLLNLSDGDIKLLAMFCKDVFDNETITKAAKDAVCLRKVKAAFDNEIVNPSDNFIRNIVGSFHEGDIPKAMVDMYRRYVLTAIADHEAKIRGTVGAEPDNVGYDIEDDLDTLMTQYVEAVRGIITADGHNDRTLRWYKTKNSNPYVSYRNCGLFYVRFDEDKKTSQDIQFLNPYKDQDYRWFSRKITDTYPATSTGDVSAYKDKIMSAAADIDEAWRVQSQRIKENSSAESPAGTDA